MMKSKRSLKSLVKHARLLKLFILLYLISGCSSSTKPSFLKENIDEAIQDICKNEYKMSVKAELSGSTLWVYLPLMNIVEKNDSPDEGYPERFVVEENRGEFKDQTFLSQYLIKPVPEKRKYSGYKYSKDASEKINNVWKTIRRVLFSMESSGERELRFFCLVIADIKNGVEVRNVFYYLDIKKVSYGYISWEEYQHRTIEETNISAEVIGDSEGKHVKYIDIKLPEFLAVQIQQRVKLKFEKPEVPEGADIDKEIQKIAIHTIRAYDFKDFSSLELYNAATKNRIILNRSAVWAGPVEKRF